MKPLNTIIVAATGVVFLVGLVHVISAAAAEPPGATWDRFEQCKIDCNEAYGGVDLLPPAVGGAGALGYSNCVLKCDRSYWKDFDRQFEDR
jgi:hypothetical protein